MTPTNPDLLKGANVVVTGGSRGLGSGVVAAFAARGAHVVVVARDVTGLDNAVAADVVDADAAARVVRDVGPRYLVLNAGAVPPMAPIDSISWEDFTANWNTDVRGALVWVQAALRRPLAPGSRVLLVGSGGAQAGSPLSGGYAGAKRGLWFIAKYAQQLADQKQLNLRFQVINPLQMVEGTGVGNAGADAYARVAGVSRAEFIRDRFGAPLSPRAFGDSVVEIMTNPAHESAMFFGVKADSGVSVLSA